MKCWKHLVLSVNLSIILLFAGCVSYNYQGQSFPPTEQIQILSAATPLEPYWQIIGRGQARGEFSGTSNQDLARRLRQLGMQHGAEAMIIVGTQILPAGEVANSANSSFITATDDPDQAGTEQAFSEIIGSSGGTSQHFERIMYADFLRKKIKKIPLEQ